MLCISSLAGETLATFSAEEVEDKSVLQLKSSLAKQIGATRFQQRWLTEDHTELQDDAVAPCCDVQLVVVDFVQADEGEIEQLISACRENRLGELVDLLRKPLNPRGAQVGFWRALHLAVENGHSQVVEILLEAGIDADADANKVVDDQDIDQEDFDGKRTALHLAACFGHPEVVKLLLEAKADVEGSDKYGRTALHLAAEKGNSDVVQLLLRAGSNKDAAQLSGKTALHWAAEKGHWDIVKILLEAGANKDATEHLRKTALHRAAQNGHSEVVKLLLKAGGNKDATDLLRKTALHQAAAYGHLNLVKLLLEEGADKTVTDVGGQTALHLAAQFSHSDVVEILLQGGADKDAVDQYNTTPLRGGGRDCYGLEVRFPLELALAMVVARELAWIQIPPRHYLCRQEVLQVRFDSSS